MQHYAPAALSTRSRRTRGALFLLGLLTPLVGLPAWLIWRAVRQERLNHALIMPITYGDPQALIVLLNQGADPNTRVVSSPPFFWHPLWSRFIRRPTAPSTPSASWTALHFALAKTLDDHGRIVGNPARTLEIVQALIDHGADLNARDEWGNTPLFWAISFRDVATIKLLLDRGAEVDARGGGGYTPLMSAVISGRLDAAGLLLDRGADVNARDRLGQTPLMMAVTNPTDPTGLTGSPQMVRLLLDRHADAHRVNRMGRTALGMAQKLHRTVIIEMLKQAGAKQ